MIDRTPADAVKKSDQILAEDWTEASATGLVHLLAKEIQLRLICGAANFEELVGWEMQHSPQAMAMTGRMRSRRIPR